MCMMLWMDLLCERWTERIDHGLGGIYVLSIQTLRKRWPVDIIRNSAMLRGRKVGRQTVREALFRRAASSCGTCCGSPCHSSPTQTHSCTVGVITTDRSCIVSHPRHLKPTQRQTRAGQLASSTTINPHRLCRHRKASRSDFSETHQRIRMMSAS